MPTPTTHAPASPADSLVASPADSPTNPTTPGTATRSGRSRTAGMARVEAVAPGSPAERAGLRAGDELLAIDGRVPRDVIEYELATDEPEFELAVRRGHDVHDLTATRNVSEPFGASISSALFDRVRTCDNHCDFCFIHQLPKQMRRSLYMKDDDYRLSFLYGNFTTLTRFTEMDLERVLDERLSPLFVSIHATDPQLRSRLLRNRRGAVSLRWLAALLDGGIEVHGQIVVCPGVNDGAALEDTLLGILDRYSRLATVACVPLGVSRHSTGADLRPHTPAEAAAVLDTVAGWQEVYRATLGRRLVYAADEYHLLAGRPFPDASAYEGFPQHENGVGMVPAFRAAFAGDTAAAFGVRPGFFAWVDGAPPAGYRAPRAVSGGAGPAPAGGPAPVAVLTGEYGAAVLDPLLAPFAPRVRVVAVPNRFFGGNIAVTGLLTGEDVGAALADPALADPHLRVLLPDVCLSEGRFLDDRTLADLPRAVEVVATDGWSLRRALDGPAPAGPGAAAEPRPVALRRR